MAQYPGPTRMTLSIQTYGIIHVIYLGTPHVCYLSIILVLQECFMYECLLPSLQVHTEQYVQGCLWHPPQVAKHLHCHPRISQDELLQQSLPPGPRSPLMGDCRG